MIKQNKYKMIISAIITLLPMIFGFIVWDRLPENIATSFGWKGEITGYSSNQRKAELYLDKKYLRELKNIFAELLFINEIDRIGEIK